MERKVKVGDVAPDFTLLSQSGETISLRDILGKKIIVLYFYPKDDSKGCTAEACSFRDKYEVFRDQGAEVIGISSDSVDSHSAFASRHNLPYIILSDVGGRVRKLYGVPSTLRLIPGRVTYIIDKKGIVRHIFSSQFNPENHVNEALKILKIMDEGAD